MDINNLKKIMVFAAHPDDEVIGCSGLLMKMKKKGAKIKCIICTDGSTGYSSEIGKKKIINTRKNESLKTAKKIGINEILFLNNKTQELENNKKNLHVFIENIRNFKPDLVLTHSDLDLHRDHKIVSILTKESIFKSNENIMPNLGKPFYVNLTLEYEIFTNFIKPDLIVDISKFINKKINLIKMHKSQRKNLKKISEYIYCNSKIKCHHQNFNFGEGYKIMNVLPIKL